jgi:hypothetical protein
MTGPWACHVLVQVVYVNYLESCHHHKNGLSTSVRGSAVSVPLNRYSDVLHGECGCCFFVSVSTWPIILICELAHRAKASNYLHSL